jgi:hypothetical protein
MSSESIVDSVLVGILSLALLSPLASCGADVCFFFSSAPVVSSVTPDLFGFGTTGVFHLVIVGGSFDQGAVVQLADGTTLRPDQITSTRMIVGLQAPQMDPNGFVSFRVLNPCGALSGNVVVRVVN